jgi:hypothetical protein
MPLHVGIARSANLTIAIGLMNAYNRIAISFRATQQALVRAPAASSQAG